MKGLNVLMVDPPGFHLLYCNVAIQAVSHFGSSHIFPVVAYCTMIQREASSARLHLVKHLLDFTCSSSNAFLFFPLRYYCGNQNKRNQPVEVRTHEVSITSRFVAAWRKDEVDASRHRQEKGDATRLGKIFKKNLNASKLSEHPPPGGKLSKYLGFIVHGSVEPTKQHQLA